MSKSGKIDLIFPGTPYLFWIRANQILKMIIDNDEWTPGFAIYPEHPDQNMVAVELCFNNGHDIDTINAVLRGDGLTSVSGFPWHNMPGWARVAEILEGAQPTKTSTATETSAQPSQTSKADELNISGGVNIDAPNITVGNDVVGRDKIIQTTTYIEHATIIQRAGEE